MTKAETNPFVKLLQNFTNSCGIELDEVQQLEKIVPNLPAQKLIKDQASHDNRVYVNCKSAGINIHVSIQIPEHDEWMMKF